VASFKINFATCRGLASPAEIVDAMEQFGLAETEEVGVLHADVAGTAAFGTLIRRTDLAVQKIDADTREVLTENVQRVTLYPFGAFTEAQRLEVYAGTTSGIQQVGDFLAGGLAMAVVTDPIELDMLTAVDRLMRTTNKFQLRAVRASDYAANSYMIGAYAPKFMDTDHGLQFMEQYADRIKSVQVRFAGPSGRVTAALTPNACFSYSCHEDDQPEVQQVLRKLVTG